MDVTINLSLVAQGLMIAVLVGVAKVVYGTSLALAQITAELRGHIKENTSDFALVRADIEIARKEAVAAASAAAAAAAAAITTRRR